MPLGDQGLKVLSDPIHLPGRCEQAAGFVVVALGCLAEVGAGEQGFGLGSPRIHDHRFGVLITAILASLDEPAIDIRQGLRIPGPDLAIKPLSDGGERLRTELLLDLLGVKEQLHLLEVAAGQTLRQSCEQLTAVPGEADVVSGDQQGTLGLLDQSGDRGPGVADVVVQGFGA